MAALETVTVQHERAKAPRQVRISANVRRAVDMMVLEGLKRSVAAEKADLTDHALYVALSKDHVKAYRNHQMGVIRESAAARTIAKAEELMDSAESEHVKMDAVKWLGGLEGISPVQRTESISHLNVNVPGLTVIFGDARLITSQPLELETLRPINGLLKPVPHPALGTADSEPVATPPVTAGGGGKS